MYQSVTLVCEIMNLAYSAFEIVIYITDLIVDFEN